MSSYRQKSQFIKKKLSEPISGSDPSVPRGKLVGLLCKVRSFISKDLLINLYYALIYPYLYYGNIVWSNNYSSRLVKLHKIHKKAVCVITFSSYTAQSKPLFQELKFLNIYQINNLQIILFMLKLINNELPNCFDEFYTLNKHLHTHNTRQAKNSHEQFARTNDGYFSLRYTGARLWNSIP